jgi:hypothetical protein
VAVPAVQVKHVLSQSVQVWAGDSAKVVLGQDPASTQEVPSKNLGASHDKHEEAVPAVQVKHVLSQSVQV